MTIGARLLVATIGSNQNFAYAAFDMFRNYDGASGSFGDTSVSATTSNNATSSVYASVNAADPSRVIVVAINKDAQARSVSFQIAHASALRTADVYELAAAGAAPVRRASIAAPFAYTLPARSVATLVFRP